jgi:hypothetical protein
MHQVVSVVRWTDFTLGLTSGEIVAIEHFFKVFQPSGDISSPRGRCSPFFCKGKHHESSNSSDV